MTAPNPTDPPLNPGTPGSSAPPTGAPTEWRVPDTDPRVWARGKTASEILGLTDQVVGYATQLERQVRSSPPSPPPAPAFDPTKLGDDDVIDGRTLRNYLATAAQPIQSNLENIYGNLAQSNVNTVRTQYADAFKNYGSEIDGLIQGIPVAGRTVDNLKGVVELVLGRHLAEERQRWQTEVSGDPTLRGAAPGSPLPIPGRTGISVESDALPAAYRQLMRDKGITDETLREFFRSQNMDAQAQLDWFERAKKHDVAVITERSVRRSA